MSNKLGSTAFLMTLLFLSQGSFAAEGSAKSGTFNPGGTSDPSFNPGGTTNATINTTRYNSMPDTTNPAELPPISSSRIGQGTNTNSNYQGAVPQTGAAVVHSATPTTTMNAAVSTPPSNAPQTGAINADTAPMPQPGPGVPGLPQTGAINADTASP